MLPGTSREEYSAADLVDSDPAGFQEVIKLDFICHDVNYLLHFLHADRSYGM